MALRGRVNKNAENVVNGGGPLPAVAAAGLGAMLPSDAALRKHHADKPLLTPGEVGRLSRTMAREVDAVAAPRLSLANYFLVAVPSIAAAGVAGRAWGDAPTSPGSSHDRWHR